MTPFVLVSFPHPSKKKVESEVLFEVWNIKMKYIIGVNSWLCQLDIARTNPLSLKFVKLEFQPRVTNAIERL